MARAFSATTHTIRNKGTATFGCEAVFTLHRRHREAITITSTTTAERLKEVACPRIAEMLQNRRWQMTASQQQHYSLQSTQKHKSIGAHVTKIMPLWLVMIDDSPRIDVRKKATRNQ